MHLQRRQRVKKKRLSTDILNVSSWASKKSGTLSACLTLWIQIRTGGFQIRTDWSGSKLFAQVISRRHNSDIIQIREISWFCKSCMFSKKLWLISGILPDNRGEFKCIILSWPDIWHYYKFQIGFDPSWNSSTFVKKGMTFLCSLGYRQSD